MNYFIDQESLGVFYSSIIITDKYNQFMHAVILLRNKMNYKIYNSFKIINILYI